MGDTGNMLITIFLAGLITNNYILVQFFGICPFLGVTNKLKSSIGMGTAVTVVLVMSTVITWPIYHYILYPNFVYMRTIVFILIIASIVQLTEVALKKYLPHLHSTLGIYLPLITTNCAVLGLTVLNITGDYNLVQSIVNALGSGLGLTLAMVLFSGIRTRLDDVAEPTRSFEGMPITLIAASILSLAFYGLS